MVNQNWTCDAKCPGYKGSIFEGLNHECLDYIAKGRTTNTYKPKQNLFYEGNKPYGIYHIRSGKVKLYKTGRLDREQIVQIAGPCDALGVSALMSGKVNFTSAETLEETQVCFIERSILFAALGLDPRLGENIMSRMGAEVGDTLSRLESAVQKPVKNRVAEVLCKLARDYAPAKDGSLNIQLSRTELAELADTAQETAIRALKVLEKKKIISLVGKRITVLQSELLQKEAQ